MSHRPRDLFKRLRDDSQVFSDDRGTMEVLFEQSDIIVKRSVSRVGVFRGLHYQDVYAPQLKLVRVISGKVIDMAVDVFSNSVRYMTLTPEDGWAVIGTGMAHGYYSVEDSELEYVCYGKYSDEHEHTYSISEFLREHLGISDPIMSPKDAAGKPLTITSWKNLDQEGKS